MTLESEDIALVDECLVIAMLTGQNPQRAVWYVEGFPVPVEYGLRAGKSIQPRRDKSGIAGGLDGKPADLPGRVDAD